MANSAAITAAERSMRSVFVGNIPYEATEEQLKDIFSEVGPVVSFRLVYDRETGKPKGYGFCEYKDIETAASAMRNLNAHELNGRALRVDNAASEKSREEMSLAALAGPPVESPYGPEVEPEKAPEAISKAVASLPPEQMFELMKQMKLCVQNNPSEARTMLLQNPQLAYALLQAQIIMKIVDPKVAMSILHRQNPSSNQVQSQPSQQTEMDTTPAPAPVQPPMSNTMGMNQPQPNFGPPHVPEHPPQHYADGPRMRPPMPQQPGQLVDRPQQIPPGVPYGPPRGPDRGPAFDPSRMGDRDMRQMDRDMRQMDRDMRMQPMIADRDMRQPPMGDQDMRYMPRPDNYDPRFPPSNFDPRMGPRPPSVNFPPPRPYEGGPPRPMNQSMGPGPQQMGPRPQPQPGPRMLSQPPTAGQSPGQTPPGPAPQRPPVTAAPSSAQPSTQDQEKAALIMQVLQLSDQQIAMLPPEQRQSIMILKEQIARNSQNP